MAHLERHNQPVTSGPVAEQLIHTPRPLQRMGAALYFEYRSIGAANPIKNKSKRAKILVKGMSLRHGWPEFFTAIAPLYWQSSGLLERSLSSSNQRYCFQKIP